MKGVGLSEAKGGFWIPSGDSFLEIKLPVSKPESPTSHFHITSLA